MSIILAILLFSFLVIIHELGHFLTAKKLGIKTYEFAVGMGPKIFGIEKNGTLYSLRAIPFGGYVRFGDDEEIEEGNILLEGDHFENQSPLNKIKVVIMGPLVNILTALLIMIGVIFFVGIPTNKIGALESGYPAQLSEMQVGEKIVEIDGKKISSWEDIVTNLSGIQKDTINIVTSVDNQTKSYDINLKKLDDGRYVLGISPMIEKDLIKSIKYGTLSTIRQSTFMLQTIKNLFIGKANIDDFSGPVGIVNVVGSTTKQGFSKQALLNLSTLVALISLNLGIVNLIPIPGLDGSKILFYSYEMITKKKINRDIEFKITFVGFVILIGFSIFLTYKDIVRLIKG